MLNSTNLLSVRQTVTYNTMIFVYKMLNHLVPEHLIGNCRFVRDIHTYNTRSRNDFYLDRVRTSFSQNSLFYKGLRQYNELPEHVKGSDSLLSFKRSCKSYIKQHIRI